jgi:hypothetical protein
VAVRENFEDLTLLDQHALRQCLVARLACREFAGTQ